MGHDTILNGRRGTPLHNVERYEGEDTNWTSGRPKEDDIVQLGVRQETIEETEKNLKRANYVIKAIGD